MQGCCYPMGEHANQLAHDFETPVGTLVLAASSGRVMEVRQNPPDDGKEPAAGQHNHVFIQHSDGTVASYAHLKQNSVTVEEGEDVVQGQAIGQSGNSGNTGGSPHLHFGVYESRPPIERFDVAVNFRNAEGVLDSRRGLRPGEHFRALPHGSGAGPQWRSPSQNHPLQPGQKSRRAAKSSRCPLSMPPDKLTACCGSPKTNSPSPAHR